MTNIFRGLITPLITPFVNDTLDLASLEKILNYQINSKVDCVILGSLTGEGTSLRSAEYKLLIRTAVEISNKRIPIIAFCLLNNNIANIISMITECEESGVDGLVCIIPPYIQATQEGIYKYFETIHNYTKLPIIIYSISSRTAVDFHDDTIIRLSHLPRILAFGDADGDLERPLRLSLKLNKKCNLLCGNDKTAVAYNANGGVGCISRAGNIVPQMCKQLQNYCHDGNYAAAIKIEQQLRPLFNALLEEPHPIPLKYAAQCLGLCSGKLRLPLLGPSEDTKIKIEEAIMLITNAEFISNPEFDELMIN